tara:strand:- start:62480 stop:64159 length:1680 start_codon:yes stop_codon:yes gene_type:complete
MGIKHMKHLKFFIFLCILTFTVSCGQQKRYIQYKVQKGETMSRIAQKLEMTTSNLIRLNPDVNGEPRANTFLVVPEKKLNNFKNKGNVNPELDGDSTVENTDVTEEEKRLEALKEKYEVYEVKKGDTFFNLKQRFGLTRGELLLLNPELKEGLKLGMILKIKEISTEVVLTDLDFYTDAINYNKDLKVALLLPFRTYKYKSDTLLLKEIFANNSRLVNIATDFYLGAEIAIDSLRNQGVTIEFTAFDTGERRSNQINKIISENNLNDNDVIIGPLYSEEATTVASNVNIPVIYPVYSSDQSNFTASNIVKTSPEKKVFRDELERYIIENFNKTDSLIANDSIINQINFIKKGNIIIVGNDDFESVKTSKLIQTNLTFGTSAVVNIIQPEEGYIAKTRFLELLKPNENNWVIIATDDTVIVSDAINSLISLPEETAVKVFTFDKGRVYDKVDNRKLAKIGFTYVSDDFIDENAVNSRIFNNQYQKKNNTLPSVYATKGFDITYDVLIRLASGNDLKTTLDAGISRRIETKFDYRNSTYISENKGLFIVQYNKDLTLTRLK